MFLSPCPQISPAASWATTRFSPIPDSRGKSSSSGVSPWICRGRWGFSSGEPGRCCPLRATCSSPGKVLQSPLYPFSWPSLLGAVLVDKKYKHREWWKKNIEQRSRRDISKVKSSRASGLGQHLQTCHGKGTEPPLTCGMVSCFLGGGQLPKRAWPENIICLYFLSHSLENSVLPWKALLPNLKPIFNHQGMERKEEF